MNIKTDISALDNRMSWIRNLEQLDSGNYYWMEYEIASEGCINGLFNWASTSEEGLMLCACLDTVRDQSGLYYYLLKIKTAEFRGLARATKSGYVCPTGLIGELLSLFSLYFRRRFYLVASYFGELTHHGLKVRTRMPFIRVPCNPLLHSDVFSKKQDHWTGDIHPFLKSVINLDETYQPQFILAAYHYAEALKEIGINSEMVFVKLVSSIEALSSTIKLDKKDDPIAELNIDSLNLTNDQKVEFREILEGRKAMAKFRAFVKEYAMETFKGPQESSLIKIGVKDLKKRLNAIYSARSAYLHIGEPMYLSQAVPFEDWDMDSSVGVQMDRKLYVEKQKLPSILWFEGIVRSCLLNFLIKHQRLT